MSKHSKLMIVLSVVLLTIGWMLVDRTNIVADDAEHNPAPDVTFVLLDGGTVRLRSLVGHTVLLHFWASWCLPCLAEFPTLLEKVGKEDMILLAVSADENADDVRRFIAPYHKKYKSLFNNGKIILALDPHHTLIQGTFQTFQYPETIIIGPDLEMKEKIIGIYERSVVQSR